MVASGASWWPPAQLVDQRRGLALQRGAGSAPLASAVRHRHRDAALGQVLHQVQVERQLLERQALEQRQHVLAAVGVDEVVGVLDAGLDAAQAGQRADVQRRDELARLVERDFGEDRHRGRALEAERARARPAGRPAPVAGCAFATDRAPRRRRHDLVAAGGPFLGCTTMRWVWPRTRSSSMRTPSSSTTVRCTFGSGLRGGAVPCLGRRSGQASSGRARRRREWRLPWARF